jgi:hypothetical protein
MNTYLRIGLICVGVLVGLSLLIDFVVKLLVKG